MQSYTLTTLSEFLGDFIVYRKLEPMDARLPRLREFHEALHLGRDELPRRKDPAYARVIVHLLQLAHAVTPASGSLTHFFYVGESGATNEALFARLQAASGWPGAAFLAEENSAPPHIERIEVGESLLVRANRWNALSEFEAYCEKRKLPFAAGAVALFALEGAALGARGRNDRLIERIQAEATRRILEDVLGPVFDPADFKAAYARLSRGDPLPFTAGDPDGRAYVALLVAGGFCTLDDLKRAVAQGRFQSLEELMEAADQGARTLSSDLRALHAEIYDRVKRNDPTPFKAFRQREYEATVARMGSLVGRPSVPWLLNEELVITEEVRQAALRWREAGALLFGLSDRPDEAALPTAALAAQGYPPLHRASAHTVGRGD